MEGMKQRAAADMWSDSMEELRQGFGELPFAFGTEQDAVDGPAVSKAAITSPPKPAPISIPKQAGQGLWSYRVVCAATTVSVVLIVSILQLWLIMIAAILGDSFFLG